MTSKRQDQIYKNLKLDRRTVGVQGPNAQSKVAPLMQGTHRQNYNYLNNQQPTLPSKRQPASTLHKKDQPPSKFTQ